jgi:hypothetical protein
MPYEIALLSLCASPQICWFSMWPVLFKSKEGDQFLPELIVYIMRLPCCLSVSVCVFHQFFDLGVLLDSLAVCAFVCPILIFFT